MPTRIHLTLSRRWLGCSWGADGFPERYSGTPNVVYGHWDNCSQDQYGWPKPHVLENGTYGIDAVSSGVPTAIRFPGGEIVKSDRLLKTNKPLKILAISDIHGHFGVYEWMVHLVEANDVDLLLLAGDLLGGHNDELSIEEAQRQEADRVIEILRRLSIPIVYIMGNDDQVSLETNESTILSIHGRRVEFGDFGFLGYQYSPPFMGGIFEKSETEIGRDLLSLEPLMTEETVLVTHSPAKGILDWTTLAGHVGSSSLREVIRRNPIRAHIHGHVHSSFGRQGKHFNVASAWQYRCMVIDLDDLNHGIITT